MSEKPKWTATRFECELGKVVRSVVSKNEWIAYRLSTTPGMEDFLGRYTTAEEAQAAVEAAR